MILKRKLKSTVDKKRRIIQFIAWSSLSYLALHPYIIRFYDLHVFNHTPLISEIAFVDGKTSELAKTRMGNPIVYKALSEFGEVVVKETKSISPLSKISSRFKLAREYLVLQAIQDLPNVTKLVGKIDNDAFCIEYVPHLEMSALSDPQDLVRFKKQFMQTMEALHERHIYHLDLSNQYNILIGEDFSCMLIDFGNARKVDRVMSFFFEPFLKYRDDVRALKGLFLITPELLTEEELIRLLRHRSMTKYFSFGKHDKFCKKIEAYYNARYKN
ncbi:MAG: hypothetical protein FJZ56_02230 [Chlamydiae bacterium]|nr:hypothetical protein [Chlamydiota bacterium]